MSNILQHVRVQSSSEYEYESLCMTCLCSLIHLLCLCHFPLIFVEISKVVDSVKGGGVIWAKCLLITCQCPLIHILYLCHVPLILIETSKVVDSFKGGGVI